MNVALVIKTLNIKKTSFLHKLFFITSPSDRFNSACPVKKQITKWVLKCVTLLINKDTNDIVIKMMF